MKRLFVEHFPYYLILSIILAVTTVLVLTSCSSNKIDVDPNQIENLQSFASTGELEAFLEYANEPKYNGSGLVAVSTETEANQGVMDAATVVEADIYQISGEHLYQAFGNQLRIVRLAQGGVGTKLVDLTLAAESNDEFVQIRELYYYDNKLIVITDVGPKVRFYIIDVSSPAAPIIARKITVSGVFADSKRVGDYLYTVLRFYRYAGYSDTPSVQQGVGSNLAESIDAEHFLAAKVAIDQVKEEGRYKNVTVRNQQATLLVTVPLKNNDDLAQVEAIFGQNSFLHVSSNNIYLINNAEIAISEAMDTAGTSTAIFAMPQSRTSVHQFSIAESPARPKYVASGKVMGRLVNKFGADEYDGVLRLAIQEDADELSSTLLVLQRNDGQLKEAAAIRHMAKGEILSTSYFLGKRGFMVTYKLSDMQDLEPMPVPWDPLITLDLSEALKPVVKGELIIPGYSSFLRDYESDRLVSVGVSENWSVAASMFNVADMAQPSMINRLDYAGTSEAQNEHRAFNLLADRHILAMPITGVSNGSSTSRLEVIGLNTTTGLNQLATFNFDAALGNVRRAIDFQEQFVVLLDGGAAGYNFATLQPLWQLTY